MEKSKLSDKKIGYNRLGIVCSVFSILFLRWQNNKMQFQEISKKSLSRQICSKTA